MQELKKLVTIIAEDSPKVLPVIDHNDQASLEGRLYHFIRNSRKLTDEDACLHLYGEERLTPSYRMLKSRLRKKLLNGLAFIELTEKHVRPSIIKHAECFSLIQQAYKLVDFGEPFLAEKIADQIITIAQKAELNDMLAKAYDIKQYADLASNNRAKFEKSLKMLQHHSQLEAKEYEALIINNRLRFELSLGISNSRKQGAEFKESLLKLKQLWRTTRSSRIYSYYHIVNIGYREVVGDFEGILKAINEAEKLVSNKSINKLWSSDRFNNFIKVYTYLRLNKLDEGLCHARVYLGTLKEGSPNWLAFLENYLLLALHKKDYKLAVQLCQLAANKGALENAVLGYKERWGLFVRYIKVLLQKHRSIDFNTLLPVEYETCLISKDKEGLNLSLLILDYLENLPKLDAEDFEQLAMRFSKYSSKYLKDKAAERSKLFIKLLLLSMKEEGGKLQKKSVPLLERLKSTPPPRDPIAEVEIVPYEHLWELTLELMQQRVKQ